MLKQTLLLFLFIKLLISQTVLNFYSVDINKHMTQFEINVLNKTFFLLEKKYGQSYKITTKYFHNHKELFQFIRNGNYEESNTIFGGYLTINEERLKKYKFSIPFLKSGKCILSLPKDSSKSFIAANTKIAYMESTTDFDFILDLKKKYSIIPFPVKNNSEKIKLLTDKKITFISADYATAWTLNLHIHKIFYDKELEHLAFMFSKNFLYEKDLNNTLEYFIGSNQYYKFIRKYFGKKAADFYKIIN